VAGISVVVVSSTALLSLYAPGYELHSALISVSVWLIISSLMLTGLKYHPHKLFGWGNRVTAGRAAVTTLLAGFTPVASQIPAESIWLWLIALTATCTLCLDGLDGYLARKTKLTSAYGARFDMETDALLGLVITLFVQHRPSELQNSFALAGHFWWIPPGYSDTVNALIATPTAPYPVCIRIMKPVHKQYW